MKYLINQFHSRRSFKHSHLEIRLHIMEQVSDSPEESIRLHSFNQKVDAEENQISNNLQKERSHTIDETPQIVTKSGTPRLSSH